MRDRETAFQLTANLRDTRLRPGQIRLYGAECKPARRTCTVHVNGIAGIRFQRSGSSGVLASPCFLFVGVSIRCCEFVQYTTAAKYGSALSEHPSDARLISTSAWPWTVRTLPPSTRSWNDREQTFVGRLTPRYVTLNWSVWRAGVPPEAEASKGSLVSLVRKLCSGWERSTSQGVGAVEQALVVDGAEREDEDQQPEEEATGTSGRAGSTVVEGVVAFVKLSQACARCRRSPAPARCAG